METRCSVGRICQRCSWQANGQSTDSIGANIAESFGRFNYGEKLQFLYYSRGSLFEAKYWLNRALARELMQRRRSQSYAARLSDVARQLNTFANSLKSNEKTANAIERPFVNQVRNMHFDDWLKDDTSPFTDLNSTG
jgi:four helix bundle protein